MSRKTLISNIQNYFSIISFYSQKHMERVQRHQKLSYLVNFVVSKYTLEQEKSELKLKFTETVTVPVKKRVRKEVKKQIEMSSSE